MSDTTRFQSRRQETREDSITQTKSEIALTKAIPQVKQRQIVRRKERIFMPTNKARRLSDGNETAIKRQRRARSALNTFPLLANARRTYEGDIRDLAG